LLSAPLLIGCDLSKLDDFTLNLLTNDEVLDLDQDPLGKQAQQIIKKDNYQVWTKDLEYGNKAIGIFNLSEEYQNISVSWNEIGGFGGVIINRLSVRDLWRQKDLGIFEKTFTTKVAPHGVTLITATPFLR
jgi:alpha-galactosidase